jgi:hypothetical protein
MQWVAAPVVAALITAFAGNWVLHRWQLRNWFAQQRHADHQQELDELRKLLDEILLGASARLDAMRSVHAEMKLKGEVDDAVMRYKREISAWNTKLHSWFAKVTFYLNWSMTYSLEHHIHGSFVRAGKELEKGIKIFRMGRELPHSASAAIELSLNALSGAIDNYLRSFLKYTDDRRREIRYGRHLGYNSRDILEYSTLQLIKSLFISDVDAIDIVRPA